MIILRGIATVLVLALPVGNVILSCEMAYKASKGIALDVEAIMALAPYQFKGLLAFPLGVLLHWIVAKATGTCPRWARCGIFVGSVLTCSEFPLGTIMGGVSLCLLFSSDAFKKRGKLGGTIRTEGTN